MKILRMNASSNGIDTSKHKNFQKSICNTLFVFDTKDGTQKKTGCWSQMIWCSTRKSMSNLVLQGEKSSRIDDRTNFELNYTFILNKKKLQTLDSTASQRNKFKITQSLPWSPPMLNNSMPAHRFLLVLTLFSIGNRSRRKPK